METNAAAEHLQVIRTLMERAALYRRALAPIMLATGVFGSVAAFAGWALGLASERAFVGYWLAVGLAGLLMALLLVRRQALRAGEPFWSPPTRRVARAFVPPLVVGMIAALPVLLREACPFVSARGLPVLWVLLYGCALHAAGFFMVRGIRLFGWVFVLAGCGLLARLCAGAEPGAAEGHAVMGGAFGGLHLAYGVYLYFTERARTAA